MEEREPIPSDVMETLRTEVGYGCPICRSPFLTWHHFDPPYSVRPHHEPERMIALCREHHDEADSDNWPSERLRALKNSPRSGEDVKGSFPSWEHENILVRFGGNYAGGSEVLIAIEGQPLVRLGRNAAGFLALSFDLWNVDGTPLLRMIDNTLELYPKGVHDFVATAGKRKVKLWLGERDIGLELTFERVTMDELATVLTQDFERSKKKTAALRRKWMDSMGDEQRRFLEEALALSSEPSVPWWIDSVRPEIREQIRESCLTGDGTGAWVKTWARENCAQSDGTIPFLNFENLSFFFSGKRLRVRNGFAIEGVEISYSGSFDNRGGSINLPRPVQGQ